MDHQKLKKRLPNRASMLGFTLIELMIVVAIVGILASLALPSYTQYVQRGDRASARAAMLEAQQFMERYYAANNTFVGATLPSRLASIPTEAPKYNIAVGNLAVNTFTLTATPIGSVSKCGELTLTHAGAKSISVPTTPTAAQISECWR